jgi:hypothetical protein
MVVVVMVAITMIMMITTTMTSPAKLWPSHGAGHFMFKVIAPFTSPTNSNPITSANATNAT